ncbi:MAG: SRPBCC family protein, partial [Acidimicrobiales bacterium]
MIDVDRQINAVSRTVGRRVLEAGEAHVVTLSQVYETTAEDLWDCCTNPERIPRWFLPVSGDLRLGGRYQLEGNAGGEVLECEPPHRFAATWEYGDATSWIEVTITPEDDRARFTLEHLALPDEHWEQFGPGAVGIGWDLGMIGLALHLASADAVDSKAVEVWTTSPDGLR